MPHTILNDRTLIRFSGEDAEHFLHNVLTCNVETLPQGVAQICALLTPQGKILFDFLLSRENENAFLVDISAEQAAGFIQRMTMYRLRSKVEITESSESLIGVAWDNDSTPSSNFLCDVRFSQSEVYRVYGEQSGDEDRTAWDALRITNGIPESGSDFALSDVFVHDVSFDQNGGVDFKKGCYVGQEVVSRVHHRHTARKRFLVAEATADFGEESGVKSGGKTIGSLGTRVGKKALALCRVDRVKDAMDDAAPITVGDQSVTLNIPPNVSYSWPEVDDG